MSISSSMSLDDDEDIAEFVKCRICLREYNEIDRKPKFLPCSHTLCFECIYNISQGYDIITCPFCRKACEILELPNNVYALEMLKQEKKKKMEKMSTDFLDITERSLKNMFMVHKRIDDQLAKTMSSINLAGEKTQKLVEENNSNLAKMISLMELLKKQSMISPNSVPTKLFFSGNLQSKFIFRLYQSGRLKGEIHICPVPTYYPDFVQKLGEFCYRSPKEFCSSVDKAMAGVFVLFPMLHPEFQPVVPSMTEHMDSWTAAAKDVDEVGITMVKASGNKITDWSLVFILEDDEDFQMHENLPQTVTDNEVFGRVIHHHMLEPLVRLSLTSKSDRANYVMTLESQ
ncbi:hypothetical protein DAPPUDRAFT_302642 [Daphnia pulex]|uniref:RING-type domain-containing protein n=1 Tax=Daphnia pulex TaxID=6669 RepID=E9GEC5_DAPPU|nr:hypothetical protein DAPPUDRAFT_302642 [Daphnia pulex]|eukprot:EFX82237.1 hypothetical protein DAPPUDRAFT_302642 [Daphnia pulex]